MTPCKITFPPEQQGQAALSGTSSSLPSFFVVEDDPSILDIMKYILVDERSYSVLPASSAQQALDTARALVTRPRMIILDYMLGRGMNGIELYDALCEQLGWQDIPTVMMSAALPREEVAKRRLISVHKPFDIDKLLEIIDATLKECLLPTNA